jgi:hypothetical protein
MPAFLDVPPNHAPVVITEDGGGLVQKYLDQALRYALEKREVQIAGSCRSACMLALSLDRVCVWPEAEVKVHHAYDRDTGRIRYDITNLMTSVLPEKIQKRLAGNIRSEYWEGATMTGDELVSLGVKRCELTSVSR